MASKTLLFPEPFGPVTATRPLLKLIIVFLNPNDLNP
jgi:hypothetical protein